MVPENRTKTCTYTVCHMVPETHTKTCTYCVCHMVPETRTKTCTYCVCHMVPEQKTCSYTVCHMVPEQRVKTCNYTPSCHMVPEQKTCSYTVCRMVPEQRVKTCTYCVCHMVPEGSREDLLLHGLPHGPGNPHQDLHLQVCHMESEQRVKTCTYQVCHMVPETHTKTYTYQVCHMIAEKCVKSVPYTICKPVHYTKTIQCTRYEPKQVAYTVTRCVPKVVCKQVPVKVCCRLLAARRANRLAVAKVTRFMRWHPGLTGMQKGQVSNGRVSRLRLPLPEGMSNLSSPPRPIIIAVKLHYGEAKTALVRLPAVRSSLGSDRPFLFCLSKFPHYTSITTRIPALSPEKQRQKAQPSFEPKSV